RTCGRADVRTCGRADVRTQDSAALTSTRLHAYTSTSTRRNLYTSTRYQPTTLTNDPRLRPVGAGGGGDGCAAFGIDQLLGICGAADAARVFQLTCALESRFL